VSKKKLELDTQDDWDKSTNENEINYEDFIWDKVAPPDPSW